MRQIILATRNKHKVEEINALIQPIGFDVRTAADFPSVPETVEDQPTLEGNALKKAREIFSATRILSIADDTGLEVYALGNAPGVYSARYAGEKVTYAENNEKLLREMKGMQRDERRARFRTVIAIVGPEKEWSVEGVVEGRILEAPQGTMGFGYDPLFVPLGFDISYAEMSLSEKNRVSHRAMALQKALAVLTSLV